MSPKTAEAQQKVRDQSRKKILNAALEIFAQKGFHASSVDEIARKAKISKGLVYNYFDTKEDLLKQVINEAMQFGDGFMSNADEMSPEEEFKIFVKSFFHLLKTQTDTLRLIMSLSIQVRTFDFVQEIAESKTGVFDSYFRRLLKGLGFKASEGEIIELECVLEGAGTIYYIMGDDQKLDTLEAHLISKYCKK